MILRDADIREPLFDFLEETFGKIRILEEKMIGRSRADVVMVTEDALCGLEIKSDADSYARLARQIKDYDKFYDYNYVVAGTRHAMHIEEHVPEYWGVITVEEVEGTVDFYILRQPKRNPKCRLDRKLMFLWKPELAKVQQLHAMPKYKDKSKDFVITKIVERTNYPKDKKGYIDKEELDREVSELLLERDYTRVEETLREYRKGELQKQIEAETDSVRRLALMMEQEQKKHAVRTMGRKRRRK